MNEFAKCPNCGTALAGPYCASCGQKTPRVDLTLRDLVSDATQELMQWDGKVPRTLKTLLTKPGILTLDFLEGRRARWLPPFRIYLICSIAYFLSGAFIEAVTHRAERGLAQMTVAGPEGSRLTPEGRAQIEASPTGRIFGIERIERAVANNRQFNRAIETAYPKAMFLLVPLFALLTFVAWRATRKRYPAHLYLALHLHAAWFGALTIVDLLTMFTSSIPVLSVAGIVALGYVAVYSLVALHRVFAESWLKTVAKAVAVATLYSASLFATSLAILGYALSTT